MARRHRRPPRLRRRTRRVLAGCALLALLIPLTGLALREVITRAGECTGTLTLQVAAAPAIAPALRDIAEELEPGELRVNTACVAVHVIDADSAAVAAALVAAHGGRLDVGGVAPATQLPQVWVPESRAWPLRVEGALAGSTSGLALSAPAPSIAFDAVGLAVPAPVADAHRPELALDAWDPRDLSVGIADPRRYAASLAALAAFGNVDAVGKVDVYADAGQALVKADATPMSKRELDAYNQANPGAARVLLATRPAVTGLDFPYTTRADLSGQLSQAAEKFLAALDDADSLACMTEMGLSPPDKYQPVLTTAAVEAALGSA